MICNEHSTSLFRNSLILLLLYRKKQIKIRPTMSWYSYLFLVVQTDLRLMKSCCYGNESYHIIGGDLVLPWGWGRTKKSWIWGNVSKTVFKPMQSRLALSVSSDMGSTATICARSSLFAIAYFNFWQLLASSIATPARTLKKYVGLQCRNLW